MATPRHQQRIAHRRVYELRYDEGYTYLDRCGGTLNLLLREFPEWAVSAVNPGNGQLAHPESNKTFSFSPHKLDLGQTQNQKVSALDAPSSFAAEAEKFSKIVLDELGVNSFARIGIREWCLFGVDSTDDAHRFVLGMKALNAEAVIECTGGTASAGGFSVVVEKEGVDWRVAVSTVEQNVTPDPHGLRRLAKSRTHALPVNQHRALLDKIRAEKALKTFPPFSILVDIDAYLEEPPIPTDLDIADFVAGQLGKISEAAEKIIGLGE